MRPSHPPWFAARWELGAVGASGSVRLPSFRVEFPKFRRFFFLQSLAFWVFFSVSEAAAGSGGGGRRRGGLLLLLTS